MKQFESDIFSEWENDEEDKEPSWKTAEGYGDRIKKEIMKQFEDAVFPEWENDEEDKEPSWKTAEGYGEGYSETKKLDPKFNNYPPLATPEEIAALNRVYENNPVLRTDAFYFEGEGLTSGYNEGEPWIQTNSGRRFNPINPNPKAIVIQDIAHSLANICRFTGHCQEFYSVAQHCVLVSYICDKPNALHGLLHDASEFAVSDVSSPLKRTPEFLAYRKVEDKLQIAICQRFGLAEKEPADVKAADRVLLATEARDLLPSLRPDWDFPIKPLPFRIDPLPPKEAKKLFLARFTELISQRDTLPGPIKEIKVDKDYWRPRNNS